MKKSTSPECLDKAEMQGYLSHSIKGVYQNPRFIRDVPYHVRKKWADRLRAPTSRQCRKAMCEGDDEVALVKEYNDATPMCCLMHGHVAFGGTDADRNSYTPTVFSPFSKAVLTYNPLIGVVDEGFPTRERVPYPASACNDNKELTLVEIAALICWPAGKEKRHYD